MIKKRYQTVFLNYTLYPWHLYALNFWKKFEITYTNRIYKIFLKKKFIKMNFNYAHPTIMYHSLPAFNFINHPYEKTLITWMRVNPRYFNKCIQHIVKVRPLNYYTWRGLYYSRWPWTKKVGKISEYV